MSENPESSTSATDQSSAQHGPNQPSTSRKQVKNPASFNEVMEEERELIQKARQARKQPGDANQLVGLAFSGGGIRSATFNLGVLQGLAELKLLPLFDYLSTVSGGGYIGGWLTAWIKHEQNLDTVQESLTPNLSRSASKDEPRQIKFLRSFSNYLTPKVGLFSADTWTFIAAYLRNLLLNLTILISALTAVLLLPRLIAWMGEQLHLTSDIALVLSIVTFLFLAFAVGAIMWNLVYVMPGAAHRKYPPFTRQGSVQSTIVIPIFLAAWFGSMWLWLFTDAHKWESWYWAIAAGAVYFLPWFIGLFTFKHKDRFVWTLSALPAGAVGGLLFWALAKLFKIWAECDSPLWHVISWGTPLFICVFSLTGILHLGLVGRRLPNEKQEWWARLGSWMLIYTLGWAALFGIALSSPLMVHWASDWIKGSLSAAWLLSTIGGVLAGKSPKTGSRDSNPWLEMVAQVAPHIFVVGLLAALSLGIHATLPFLKGYSPPPAIVNPPPSDAVSMQVAATIGEQTVAIKGSLPAQTVPFSVTSKQYWNVATGSLSSWLWLWIAIAAAVSLLLSCRVDINRFSLHLLYRNRITRAYLGASNPNRRPHPFTGFDPKDDFLLAELAETTFPGPYHIINTALNLVGGEELAWQERKAASFVFAPKYSGYEPAKVERLDDVGNRDRKLKPHGYRPSGEYGGGISLGTAVAISGAAASPNMGYHSSAPLAFLMTVFNVRLGWWLGNPRHQDTWKYPGPLLGLFYLVLELFGHTNDRSRCVYLSDGGHFENLGIYELVRRRCRYIVASDGSQDGALTFEDLGNAVRKCRTDLGIEIEMNVEPIRRRGDRSLWHCAVGIVHYEQVDANATPGLLVYLKPSLIGDEPADILNYSAREPEFPHQATADQWFDESQFESYRRLGYHIAKKIFQAVAEKPGELGKEALFVALRQHWYPPSSAAQGAFSKHGSTLDDLFKQLREHEKLAFLDAQIYPEWERLTKNAQPPRSTNLWLPNEQDAIRHGFYYCNSLIQLMESVYLDLNLEQDYDHPDNRGWMNLFNHWSWAGMFRLAWAISASTYGARFQRFCERRVNLTLGEIEVSELPAKPPSAAGSLGDLLQQAQEDLELNVVEAELIEKFQKEHPVTALGIYLLQLVVKDPMNKDQSTRFTFGFALVDAKKNLVYLRVQDHVRKMGLARQAIKELIRAHGIQDAQPLAMPKDAPEVPTEADQKQIVRLFRSVKYES